jgi:DNA polymerase III epsilon subunit-like protein
VSRIHGITDRDVAAAPAWGEVAPDVLRLLDGAWIVAHSATVEYNVLARHLPAWQPAGVLDTLRLARATVPDAGRFGLDPLIEHCGLDTDGLLGQRHRAGFDAAATALLLLHLSQFHASWDDMAGVGVPAGLPGCPDSDVVEGTLW